MELTTFEIIMLSVAAGVAWSGYQRLKVLYDWFFGKDP